METTELTLADLPAEHPLRNIPLAQISAEYQWVQTKRPNEWHRVTRHFKIAKNTFNELGTTWTESYRWKARDDRSESSSSTTS